MGPVDRFREIDMRIYNSAKGTSRIVKYQRARESIHNYFGWLLVELRYGWKAVCQGKEAFSKNKSRVFRSVEWAGPNQSIEEFRAAWTDR